MKFILVFFLISATFFVRGQTTKLVFPYTGAVQSFVVPCGVYNIYVKAWGAGGSGGGRDSYLGAIGGGGGYIETQIAVVPFQVFTLIVGGGALGGADRSSGPGTGGVKGFGFGLVDGGRGGNSGAQGSSGGGGGGGAGTALFLGTTPIVIAGGGGGGSGGGKNSSGGAGGSAGQNGFAAGGGGCTTPGLINAGTTGNGLQGLDKGGGDGGGGGGGGGGYRGGGGGFLSPSGDNGACGGAGGTSFSTGSIQNIIYSLNSAAANKTDPDYVAGVGDGGNSATKGGDGRLIVEFITFLNPVIAVNNATICLGQQIATLTASGADVYAWSTNDVGPSIIQSPNSTTNYTVIGSYLNGCYSSAVANIQVNPLPPLSVNNESICLGQQIATLTVNGVNTYTWSTGDIGPSIVRSPTITTTYTVVGVDVLGCYNYTTALIWLDPLPVSNFSFVNNCINNQPNTFDASLSSISLGTNDIYNWSFGDGQNGSLMQTNADHSYSNAGIYSVSLTVISNKGCFSSVSNTVEVYQKPILDILASSLVCLGQVTTFTASQATNSGNTILFEWDVNNTPNTIELTGMQTSYTFPTEGTNTVNLVATTDKFCKENFSRTVYINYLPKPNFKVDDPDGCPLPHCVTFTDSSIVTAPAVINNWHWYFGNNATNSISNNANQTTCYTNLSSNQLALYTVTLTTTTDSGCVASNVKTDFITVFPKPIANYNIIPEFGNVVVPLVHFINESVDYSKFIWNFGDAYSDSIIVNPDHLYDGNNSQDYYSSLIVTNTYGCIDTAIVKVNIAPDFIFYIPNAFTPNGDGINDVFTGAGVGIIEYKMWVYDRWGEFLYFTEDISKGWNGKISEKNTECKQDIYTWKVELKDVFKRAQHYAGQVTLLKG